MAETIKRSVKKNGEETKKTTAKKTTKKAETEVKETSEKNSGSMLPKGSANGLRIAAVILWVLAIAAEVVAILVFTGKIELPLPFDVAYIALGFMVIDLILLIIGSQLWKKANHKDPASEKNKVKFWLWNNMGVLVATVAFIPFIIIALTDKNASAKSKKIAAIGAAVALAIGVLCSIDYHPFSQEKQSNAEAVLGDTQVYWTPGGSRYHLDENCSSLSNSAELKVGVVKEAIEEDGKDYLCKFCLRNHQGEIPGLENLIYGAETPAENNEAAE